MKLSQSSARELQPGGLLRDHVVKGLQLRARQQSKSWHFYYTNSEGAQKRPKLGNWPTLTLEQARDVAREWAQRVARGEDPSEARKVRRDAPTVAQLIDANIEHKAGTVKPSTLEQAKSRLKLYVLPTMGNMRVADVTAADIKKLRDRIRDGKISQNHTGGRQKVGGVYAANLTLAYLSAAFSMAERSEFGWRPKGSNPCADVPKLRTFKRRMHVPAAKIPGVLAELRQRAAEGVPEAAALLVMLYAGTRVTELVTARSGQLQSGGRVLVLSEHKTDRTGRDRTIHLPSQARDVIAKLPTSPSGLIFGDTISRHSVFGEWEALRERLDLPGVQVRDFRRTFATAAKSAGVSVDQIGELFDHATTATTDGYSWLFDEAAENAAQRVADSFDDMRGDE